MKIKSLNFFLVVCGHVVTQESIVHLNSEFLLLKNTKIIQWETERRLLDTSYDFK